MRLPDPFTLNLKIDTIDGIQQMPRMPDNYSQALGGTVRQRLDSYLQTKQPQDFPSVLPQFLITPTSSNDNSANPQYNIQILNLLTAYLGEKGIISANNSSKPGSNEMFNPRSPSHAIFSHLAISLGPEGRYHLFNAMANQLRYPCSLTYYFRCTLLQLFLDAPQQYIQEQITRVLLERLIVHRPDRGDY